jgi:hypothetical protein
MSYIFTDRDRENTLTALLAEAVPVPVVQMPQRKIRSIGNATALSLMTVELLRGVRMSRYFFHVMGSDHGQFRDGSGLYFDTLEDAARHATKIAVELAQDGDHYRGSAVAVTDEDDNELMRVAVKPPTEGR